VLDFETMWGDVHIIMYTLADRFFLLWGVAPVGPRLPRSSTPLSP
jgi:hypothetical protein